jgi:RNA polymerase sigma factor for flagellar operon FliA
VQIEDADDGTLGEEESAFAQVAALQDHARVRQLCARLPERERTILSLYYEEELTYREIGQVLGVTESRICQILRGIHRNLREELQESV